MTAETIKQLREARGWTQAELARRLNISRNGVNTWEQGLSMPSPHFLVELAKIFSVSTDFLLGVGGWDDDKQFAYRFGEEPDALK